LFDPARDWQLAVHMARVPGGLGAAETLTLPLAIDAQGAKAVNAGLARNATRQVRRSDWPVGFAALAAFPGTAVTIGDGVAGRVAERRIEGAGVRLVIEAERSDAASVLAADAGRVVGSPDLLIGASQAWLFDLPLIDGMADNGSSRTMLAVASQGLGWRQAAVSLVPSTGALAQPLGSVAAVAVLGEVVAMSGRGQPWLFDRAGTVTVVLLREDMQLNNADDAALLGGANLAVAGDELFQFGHAEPLGGRQWRLSHLLRGRYGTEDAISDPAIGRGFALIGDAALMSLPVMTQSGGSVLVQGQGDIQPVIVPVIRAGRALRPLSPVRLVSRWLGDGGLHLGWTRRSRTGSGWADLIDAPMDEREERYRVTLAPTQGSALVLEREATHLIIDAATVADWQSIAGPGASVAVTIMQIGAAGVSPPLIAALTLS
jgi:hypothetical protein